MTQDERLLRVVEVKRFDLPFQRFTKKATLGLPLITRNHGDIVLARHLAVMMNQSAISSAALRRTCSCCKSASSARSAAWRLSNPPSIIQFRIQLCHVLGSTANSSSWACSFKRRIGCPFNPPASRLVLSLLMADSVLEVLKVQQCRKTSEAGFSIEHNKLLHRIHRTDR